MKEFVGVEDLTVSTAEEFLDTLSPRREPWNDVPQDWIYRGQANADWSLQPTGHRADWKVFEDLRLIRPQPRERAALNWSERGRLMNLLLDRFASDLNLAGLSVPTESPDASPRRGLPVVSYLGAHPPRPLWPLMALAQHHKLPTLFLDWSRRARVAAYFAAYAALDPETKDRGSELAVWGANRWRTPEANPLRGSKTSVEFYSAPASTNPNLNAQSGLFTISLSESDEPLEAAFAEIWRQNKAFYMRRVTLPHSEAPKLLRLLADEDVTGSSLFPGTDGVVRAMQERRFWDKHPTLLNV
jgi:hypothetical protein